MLFPESFTDAMIACAKDAAAGGADAQFMMAQMYRHGRGVPVNLREAIFWYKRAFEGGLSKSGYHLAQLHTAEKDFEEARHWYRKAANAGHVPSMVALGNFFARGIAVTMDLAVAAEWYGRAARHGNAGAQFVYGLMLRDGRGMAADRIAAYVWIDRAIDNDLPEQNRAIAIAARRALLQSMAPDEQIRAKAVAESDITENIGGPAHDRTEIAQTTSAA